MSSLRSRSAKLLVYVDGGRRDMSNGGCRGEGGCFGQWNAKVGRSAGSSSGSIVAGGWLEGMGAVAEADVSVMYLGWT